MISSPTCSPASGADYTMENYINDPTTAAKEDIETLILIPVINTPVITEDRAKQASEAKQISRTIKPRVWSYLHTNRSDTKLGGPDE